MVFNRPGDSLVTAIITGGSGFRIIKHSSRFHSNSCLIEVSPAMITNNSFTYSSHLKDQRKLSVPVCFNSTIDVGLHNSIVLNLLTAAGAAAVASNDSDMGSSSSNCDKPSTM